MKNLISENDPAIKRGRGLWNARLFIFNELDSTNKKAFSMRNRLKHGDTILARSQTLGKGRMNRTWFSKPGKSLCFSIFIERDRIEPLFFLVTQIASISVAETLEELSIEPSLKWPNDVLVNGSKICGILAQGDPSCNCMVLGIGLNVNLTKKDLQQYNLDNNATSIEIETGKENNIIDVFQLLKKNIESSFKKAALTKNDFIQNTWKKYDYFNNEKICIETAGEKTEGIYLGTDDTGRLKLLLPNGNIRHFWAGDVFRVRS
ncbi:biotin--[acetyl-CoA-carboxylase] ligase [bacterium]|nr:biotin--[acetyl-CoA-carboxylase] ligase [bacterium]